MSRTKRERLKRLAERGATPGERVAAANALAVEEAKDAEPTMVEIPIPDEPTKPLATEPANLEVLARCDGSDHEFIFECPACGSCHWLKTDTGRWKWNGDMVKPSVSPSIVVEVNGEEADDPKSVCHFFIKAGRLRYLQDCTHALAGQTVPMVPWESMPKPGYLAAEPEPETVP